MMRNQKTEYWNVMKGQLDCFYISSVELKKCCYEYPKLEFSANFPVDRIPPGSKVVLYGAGTLGKAYMDQNSLYQFCMIVSWVDADYRKKQAGCYEIECPEAIKGISFDYVLIAVDDYYNAREIVRYLNKLGVRREKIIWNSTKMDKRGFEEVYKGFKGELI